MKALLVLLALLFAAPAQAQLINGGGASGGGGISGAGFPVAGCSNGETYRDTNTMQIWDCTDGVSVWTNRVTGVTSSGAAAYNTGLLARYRMTDCTSTTIPDSSGNSNTGIFATGSGPLFGAAPTCSAGTGVVFNGVYSTGALPAFNTVQFISIPNAAVASQTDIIYYLPASGGSAPLIFAGAVLDVNGTVANTYSLRVGDSNPILGGDGIPSQGGSSQSWQGITPLAVSHCGTTVLYYQGTPVTGNVEPGSQGPFSGVTSAAYGAQLGSYVDPFVGTLYYGEHYSSCLTAAQINTETARINAELAGRGLSLGNTLNTARPVVVWDGTSITQGYNLYSAFSYAGFNGGISSYVGLARAAFGNSIQTINNGITSQTLAAAITKLQSADLSQTANRFGAVVILDYPTNDIHGNSGTVTTAETNTIAACGTIHAAGARCIITTVLPCTSGACGANFSTNRATWNIWALANCFTVADACADPASDPTVGPDSAASSTTYYGDGQHPTLAADAIIAPYYEAAISRLLQLGPNAGPACVNGATPAVCGAATSGSVAVPTGTNPTLVINTTAVTNLNRILVQVDESLVIPSITCNTTLATLLQPVVTARSIGVSFTIQVPATLAVNPACVSWSIVNQ